MYKSTKKCKADIQIQLMESPSRHGGKIYNIRSCGMVICNLGLSIDQQIVATVTRSQNCLLLLSPSKWPKCERCSTNHRIIGDCNSNVQILHAEDIVVVLLFLNFFRNKKKLCRRL